MIKELCCWHLHCCSPVLFLQTFSHGPYEKTDQLPITYFVWVVGIKTATEISWASITLCFFAHQNNMEMTEMVSVERYYMRCLDPRRKSQRSVFAQKNLSTQDVWTGWCLGFQVFFCKCLDSQDFAGAWAVCAQLGTCLDSQGSLQDLASLSCLSSVGEMLLSSMGAVFLSSVWAASHCWSNVVVLYGSLAFGLHSLLSWGDPPDMGFSSRSSVYTQGHRLQHQCLWKWKTLSALFPVNESRWVPRRTDERGNMSPKWYRHTHSRCFAPPHIKIFWVWS